MSFSAGAAALPPPPPWTWSTGSPHARQPSCQWVAVALCAAFLALPHPVTLPAPALASEPGFLTCRQGGFQRSALSWSSGQWPCPLLQQFPQDPSCSGVSTSARKDPLDVLGPTSHGCCPHPLGGWRVAGTVPTPSTLGLWKLPSRVGGPGRGPRLPRQAAVREKNVIPSVCRFLSSTLRGPPPPPESTNTHLLDGSSFWGVGYALVVPAKCSPPQAPRQGWSGLSVLPGSDHKRGAGGLVAFFCGSCHSWPGTPSLGPVSAVRPAPAFWGPVPTELVFVSW